MHANDCGARVEHGARISLFHTRRRSFEDENSSMVALDQADVVDGAGVPLVPWARWVASNLFGGVRLIAADSIDI